MGNHDRKIVFFAATVLLMMAVLPVGLPQAGAVCGMVGRSQSPSERHESEFRGVRRAESNLVLCCRSCALRTDTGSG